jgi:molybdopterin biosynthesis enzyme
MVTFELLGVPAIEVLSRCEPRPLPLFKAKLAHPVDGKGALTHFLPARLNWQAGEPYVDLMLWAGSGDIGAVVRGNCFLVMHESRLSLGAGEWVDVMLRRGMI